MCITITKSRKWITGIEFNSALMPEGATSSQIQLLCVRVMKIEVASGDGHRRLVQPPLQRNSSSSQMPRGWLRGCLLSLFNYEYSISDYLFYCRDGNRSVF